MTSKPEHVNQTKIQTQAADPPTLEYLRLKENQPMPTPYPHTVNVNSHQRAQTYNPSSKDYPPDEDMVETDGLLLITKHVTPVRNSATMSSYTAELLRRPPHSKPHPQITNLLTTHPHVAHPTHLAPYLHPLSPPTS